MSKFILIGADPNSTCTDNPGGQATACQGIVSFFESNSHQVDIIDTTQSSFPVPSALTRLRKGLWRSIYLFFLLATQRYSGVIIFSSSGFSFYERALQCLVCKIFSVKSVLCIRSGHFISDVKSSEKYRKRASKLLKLPTYIGVQGTPWIKFYASLGVEEQRLLVMRNWLPHNFPKTTKVKNKSDNIVSFLFVGWMVEKKGVRELLNAVLELLDQGYDFRLTFVGGGDLLESIRNTISDKNIEDKVEAVGWKDKNEVIMFLQKSDVFVLPSKAEGFPNAMLEAMSLGLPSIVTDVGAVCDSLIDGYNGFLLDAPSTNNIHDAMLKYINTPSLVSIHSEHALKLVDENHSAQENCQRIFTAFDN